MEYIENTLKSFLLQKTKFLVEVIIHDDASSDDTAEIIRRYRNMYPEIIKPIIETENQYSKGIKIAQICTAAAKGKYIALCEGDDYWSDHYKLQKQVDYMESHPSCSLCTHAAEIIDEKGNRTGYIKPSEIGRDFTVEEVILGGGELFATASMMYKREDDSTLPEFYYRAPVGDYPLAIYLAIKGNVHYMSELMSVYRKGAKGSWSESLHTGDFAANYKKHMEEINNMLSEIDKFTDFKYKQTISEKKDKNNFEVILKSVDMEKIEREPFKRMFKELPAEVRLKFKIHHRYPKMFNFLKDLKSRYGKS